MTDAELIRRLSSPLEPIPTGAAAQILPMPRVRCVLFDVYGTLFVSAAGDIGLATPAGAGSALRNALQAVGVELAVGVDADAAAQLPLEIHRRHAAAKRDHPEVDIRDVWHSVLEHFAEQQWIPRMPTEQLAGKLAIQYECRVNPVWPMPGLVECLAYIRDAGKAMGIVSNAQAFTRELFPAFTGSTAGEWGFNERLCIWSYEYLRAKPARYLYDRAVEALVELGIESGNVLYVGNDMRNDVAPAQAAGFRTALFAGDARSLRRRAGDPAVAGVEPDAVVTDLRQISDILCLAPPTV